MFPLKAAFTPKDSSRWFAFNSRLQGATPSSWPGLSLEQEGAGWPQEQDWGRAGNHTHPSWAMAHVHPFPGSDQQRSSPPSRADPTAAHFLLSLSSLWGNLYNRGEQTQFLTMVISQRRRKGQRSQGEAGGSEVSALVGVSALKNPIAASV